MINLTYHLDQVLYCYIVVQNNIDLRVTVAVPSEMRISLVID